MTEYIDRDEAIRALVKLHVETGVKTANAIRILRELPAAADRTDYTGLAIEDVKKVTDEVVKEIKALPSAEPRWIPCSERLPERGIDVLTVDGYGEYELNHIINEEDGEWYWEPVTAWMPLPEPYKGG